MVDVNKVSQSVLNKIGEIGQMDGKKGITSQAECDKLKDYLASGNVNGVNDKEYTQSLISDYYEKAGQGSPLNANEFGANAKITAKKQSNNAIEIKMNAQNANKEALNSAMRAGAIVTETAGGEITITIDSTPETFVNIASKLGLSDSAIVETLSVEPEVFNSLAGRGSSLNANELRGLE
jgi:hypothetical protein